MTEYIVNLEAGGGTNINDALIEAIEVTKKAKSELPINALPMIIFLTDGQPTEGESNGNKIKENVKENNDDIPIYGLAFGSGADFSLIKDISTDNQAFARKIFESSDATIQLENFYAEISSPLLKDISFTYVGDDGLETAENVLPGATFHKGSEVISVVKMGGQNQLPTSLRVNGQSFESPDFNDVIYPCNYKGEDDQSDLHEEENQGEDNDENQEEEDENVTEHDIEGVQLRHIHHCIPHPFPPAPQSPPSFIERLWAFLTIEKLLDEKADNKNMTEEEREEKATEIALKYNFVTDLTSLVVVKPKSSSNENGTESSSEEDSVLDLRPVEDKKYLGYNTKSYGFPLSYNAYMPSLMVSKTASNSLGVFRSGPPLSRGAMKNRKRTRPTNFRLISSATTTTTPTLFSASYDYYDSPSFSAATTTPTTTTTTQCPKIDCKIELFSKTLFRGDKIEVSADMEELGDFENKVQSIKVSGNCSWKVFVDQSYQGVFQTFPPGEYRNAAIIKFVLKKASSVQNIGC